MKSGRAQITKDILYFIDCKSVNIVKTVYISEGPINIIKETREIQSPLIDFLVIHLEYNLQSFGNLTKLMYSIHFTLKYVKRFLS